MLLRSVAPVAARAPLAIKPVHLIEQNGLKGLLDLVSQILGLVEKGGGKG